MATWLPPLNTALIVISGVAVLCGYAFIKRRDVARHRASMLVATVFAGLFLVVYVARWVLLGSKPFVGEGTVRAIYLFLLGTHIVLAIALGPMVLVTLARALRGRFDMHRTLARRTLPVWLYVAASGWAIYWMLHQR
ncbi:MAG: DUF420 domain-containing protein [Armatimonadetes bacterium]|nr:DUF420 domain-containing protein [Armatimonadota bacterium]